MVRGKYQTDIARRVYLAVEDIVADKTNYMNITLLLMEIVAVRCYFNWFLLNQLLLKPLVPEVT